MSSTSSVKMINLEVMAEDQYAIDKAAGTTAGKAYGWHGTFQVIPMGMNHKPEAFAQNLRKTMPEIDTIRIAFNSYSFNADGSLHPEFERFLIEAVKQGFKLSFNYADGETQELNADKSMSVEQVREILTGSAYDRFIDAWNNMFDWLDRYPAVGDAIHSLEGMNEPQGYGYAQTVAGAGGEFVQLYGDHMAEFAAMVKDRTDAKVMISGWGYGQNFSILGSTTSSDGTVSVMDQIRNAAGEDLIWSAHLYPHWITDMEQSLEGMQQFVKREYSFVGDDALMVTEIAALNKDLVTPGTTNSFWLARAWEAFADAGIGIGWFPAVEYGPSSLVSLSGKTPVFWHPDSYAHAQNAYLLEAENPAYAAGEAVSAKLIAGKVMDPNYKGLANIDGIGFAAGHGGNDTLTAISRAANMLYGGTGDDLLMGAGDLDRLFGQAGNDTLRGAAGNDVLSGGDGDDLLSAGSGADMLTGGRGADRFSFEAGGKDVVTDYSLVEGDVLAVGLETLTTAQIDAGVSWIDFDGDGKADDAVYGWTGGEIVLLNYRVERPDGIITGTDQSDTIRSGYKDSGGDVLTWRSAVIEGAGGNDNITGTVSADLINGGAGDDTVVGGSGSDTIRGGDGHDVVNGFTGDDLVYGGAGNDKISSGGGRDTLHGEGGNDTLTGGVLSAGGEGDDSLVGGTTADRLTGDTGNDWIGGEGGLDTLTGGDGNDTISGTHLLVGGLGDDSLVGRSTSADTITGDDGDDTISGAGGLDSLSGGAGADIISGSNLILGGDDNDRLTGMKSADSISGDAGADVISGGGGNDTLTGGTGNDTITGSFRILGGDGDDSITGLSGADVISGELGADWINGGGGLDTIYGGAGNDTLRGSNHMEGGDGNDGMTGSSGADYLTGDEGADSIYGAGGIDSIYGGAGNDRITGGNLIEGGEGNDTLTGMTTSDVIRGEAGDDSIVGGGGSDSLSGGDDDDNITGGNENDSIWGGEGDDVLSGGAGNDWLVGDGGDDLIVGGGGLDTIEGGAGNDAINVASGTNFAYGGDGNDYVNANASSNSTIDLGAGIDRVRGVMSTGAGFTVTGGEGADTFEFKRSSGAATATVTDFEVGIDIFQIDSLVGFEAITRYSRFQGFTDVGDDAVLKFDGDTYIFKDHQVSDLI